LFLEWHIYTEDAPNVTIWLYNDLLWLSNMADVLWNLDRIEPEPKAVLPNVSGHFYTTMYREFIHNMGDDLYFETGVGSDSATANFLSWSLQYDMTNGNHYRTWCKWEILN
jgi:hypothetical protein